MERTKVIPQKKTVQIVFASAIIQHVSEHLYVQNHAGDRS